MTEYIEREPLINHVEDLPTWGTDGDMLDRQDVIGSIENRPAADVAPVRHGRWEKVCTLRDETVFRCSNCNRKVKVPYGLSKERWAPYCHCGAKMDLEV